MKHNDVLGRITFASIMATERGTMQNHDKGYARDLVRLHLAQVQTDHPDAKSREMLKIIWQEVTGWKNYVRE